MNFLNNNNMLKYIVFLSFIWGIIGFIITHKYEWFLMSWPYTLFIIYLLIKKVFSIKKHVIRNMPEVTLEDILYGPKASDWNIK